MAKAKRRIDARRAQAATLFATGATQSEICAKLRITRVTLWEWRKSPVFREAVNDQTIEFLRETRELARSARDIAWKRLLKIIARSKNDAAAMRACSEILHSLGVLRPPDKLVDAAVKKFVVQFANLPGAKDE